jgi:hypothetical protein
MSDISTLLALLLVVQQLSGMRRRVQIPRPLRIGNAVILSLAWAI